MNDKIFPRNLTARAAIKIAGNPVTTRLESGVANCFPGLEFDHRNLDRRFFPGLIFNYGTIPPVLAGVDPGDPAFRDDSRPGAADLSRAVVDALDGLRSGEWRLTSIGQGSRTLDLQAIAAAIPPDELDGALFWRLVRSLIDDKVTIVLTQATTGQIPSTPGPSGSPQSPPPPPPTVTLTHFRRRYLDPNSGVISDAYLPGELTQSMCSPWMHDFRDCACDYWASNHPDIALAADEMLTTGGLANENAGLATQPLDWLRADRQSKVAASSSGGANDALRLRHYQINLEWRDLAFVLDGRENSGVYTPGIEVSAEPFATVEELADELVMLCGLEQVVMLEYLYAYYSLRPSDVDSQRNSDLIFVRHELLGIAVSEMRHLRWANQLLWTLAQRGLIPHRGPALEPGLKVPGSNGEKDRALRPLTMDVLNDFIAVERPSGTLDGAYSRVVATLRTGFPESMLQLARQIVADGVDHYNRFREIAVVLRGWPSTSSQPQWLRTVTPGTPAQAAQALELYRNVINALRTAYDRGDMEDAGAILQARQNMMALDAEAEKLASNQIGIPFF